MDAYDVKQKLTRDLRMRASEHFVSAGVMQKDGQDFVLVQLAHDNFEQTCRLVPTELDGIDIKVKKSDPILAFSW